MNIYILKLSEIYTWLFSTSLGVCALIAVGMVITALIALLLERRTQKRFYDHEPLEEHNETGIEPVKHDEKDLL